MAMRGCAMRSSSGAKHGARGRTRTGTALRPGDFKTEAKVGSKDGMSAFFRQMSALSSWWTASCEGNSSHYEKFSRKPKYRLGTKWWARCGHEIVSLRDHAGKLRQTPAAHPTQHAQILCWAMVRARLAAGVAF
jgi:hypothetical protein